MISKRERVYVILFILIMLILISLPTIIADKAGGDSYVFNGFLFNTYDAFRHQCVTDIFGVTLMSFVVGILSGGLTGWLCP